MLAHHLAQLVMTDARNPVAIDAHHGLARYQRVHDSLFGCLHGGGK